MASVAFLDKGQFSVLAPSLSAILDGNMRRILPDRLSYEEEYRMWFQAVSDGLRKEPRQIILIRSTKDLRLLGFVQYYANPTKLMLEEVQILPQFQGRPNFLGQVYRFLLASLPVTPRYVEAYAHRENTRSIALQKRPGMEPISESECEAYVRFRGSFSSFSARHQHSQ